jgi:integrase
MVPPNQTTERGIAKRMGHVKTKTKTKTHPGSIYRPSTRNVLYVKYRGRRLSTGLPDTPKNRRLAEELLIELWREEQGLPTHRNTLKPSIGDQQQQRSYADTLVPYHEYLAAQDITARTRHDYIAIVQRIITKPGDHCDHLGLERFVAAFIKANPHYRPASINIHLRNFRVYCMWLRKNRYITLDVDLSRYRRKGEGRTIVVYTDEEIVRLLEWCRTIGAARGGQWVELGLLVHFLVATGFRINEALRLDWDDVHEGEIIVPNKSTREPQRFPISAEVRSILDTVPRTHGSKVFRWNYSSQSSVLRMFKQVLHECGIEARFGFHTLRKTFQDRLYRSGIEMTERQKLMRHSSINTTVKSYTYTNRTRLEESLNKVAPLNGQPGSERSDDHQTLVEHVRSRSSKDS